MKYNYIIFLFVIGLVSCKKDTKTNATTPTPTTVSRNFYFRAYDQSFYELTNVTGNTFIINFYQNNNVVYTLKTKNAGFNSSFNISGFNDGGYICEIKDSLNLFGYNKDSLYIKNNTYYWGGINGSTSSTTTGNLGSVQQIPTYTITNYTIVKDTTAGGGSGIYLKINVSSNVNRGEVVFYWYKNNQVSSNNQYTYGPLYPNNGGHSVSSTNLSIWDIFNDSALEQYTSLHSGDSVYFAIYPAPYNCYSGASFDRFAPLSLTGVHQFTATGSQRILIPYKLH